MIIAKPMNYGEFIDAMTAVAESNLGAKLLLDDWKIGPTEEEWAEYRAMSLDVGHILAFMEDMVLLFHELVANTCSEKLYSERLESGHAFLQAIRAKCQDIGIDLESEEVDVPLTPTELMVSAGLVQVTAEGNVKLTKEGQQVAEEFGA